MESQKKTFLKVESTINAPVSKVWEMWTNPEHIIIWNSASDDWHTLRAENDLRPGGRFSSRMEAKDGSMGFDFWGIYDEVGSNEYLAYTMGDGRQAKVTFNTDGESTIVSERFQAETENSIELQQAGWQAILDNFKAYTEAN